MIEVRLIGGLGNQMFQYAAGRALALKHNTDLILDTTGFNTYKLHGYALNNFKIKARLINSSAARAPATYSERAFHYSPDFQTLPNHIRLQGYFQSQKYFESAELDIRADFDFVNPPSPQNAIVLDTIKKVNAVSVHFRRGDYVSDKNTLSVHGTPGVITYYMKAIDYIASRTENPVFFIFSDDIDWCKKNFVPNYECRYIGVNKTKESAFEDLRLMQNCKHHVIANSSFSWWSAWCHLDPLKIVIYPTQWFATNERNTKDLFPTGWVGM